MKIKLPIGKILSGAVVMHGIIVSNYAAKAIKQTEDEPTIANTVAQSGVMVGVTVPHMFLAAKLWNSETLNITIGNKHKDESADDRFSRKSAKYMQKYIDGKLSATDAMGKLVMLYRETPPETLLTKAFFFGNLNRNPELAEHVRRFSSLIDDILSGYKEDDYVAIYNWVVAMYTSRLNDDHLHDGITPEQWAVIMAILDNDCDSDPHSIYSKLVEIDKAAKEYMETTGGIETTEVFETLDEIIEHFKKINVPPQVIKKGPANPWWDLDSLTEDDLRSMTRDDVCNILLSAVQQFELQSVSAVTIAHLVGIAKAANPKGFELFEDRWTSAAEAAERVAEDVASGATGNSIHSDASAADRELRQMEAIEDAMANFCQDEKDLRKEIEEGGFSSRENAEYALRKFILRARTNVLIPRSDIETSERMLKQMIDSVGWNPLEKFNKLVDDFVRKYDPDSDEKIDVPITKEDLGMTMLAILHAHESDISAEDLDAGRAKMQAVVDKYEDDAE